MSALNKVMLIGYLGKAPELKQLNAGNSVVNFSLGINKKWKDKSGEAQEKTEWVKIVAFGKKAEVLAKYLDKGSLIYIEGEIQTRSWEDNDGNKKYATEILVGDFQFLGGVNKKDDSDPFGGF
jgi:single-strand DNA-binding protein